MYTPPEHRPTNVLAIVSLVCSFFVSIAAIVTGHIALSQIKRTGERGRGLAIGGLVVGYAGLAAGVVTAIVLGSLIASSVVRSVDAARSAPDSVASTVQPSSTPDPNIPILPPQTVAQACATIEDMTDRADIAYNMKQAQGNPAKTIAALNLYANYLEVAMYNVTEPSILALAKAADGAVRAEARALKAEQDDATLGSQAAQDARAASDASVEALVGACTAP